MRRRQRRSARCWPRAVANAQHNDEQDPDELFVKACFADEGPTLKRFTPAGPWPRQPHQQAHLPHHDRGRPSRRRPPRGRPGPRGQAHRRPAARRRVAAAAQPPPAAGPASSAAASADAPRTAASTRRRSSCRRCDARSTTTVSRRVSIKGNADSMLYHARQPFYDQTVAEIWFDSRGRPRPPATDRRVSEADESRRDGDDADDQRRRARRRERRGRRGSASDEAADDERSGRRGAAEWARRSTPTGSASASPPTGRAAGSPSATTRSTSPRTGRSARRS